jgi:hypothetical protein
MLKKIAWLSLISFILIQFFRPNKNSSVPITTTSSNIASLYPIPDSVKTLLQNACYDCHSQNTSYPWYASLQPIAWWLNGHIKEGKKELNFDAFATYSLRRQYHKMEEVIEQLKEGEMPLKSYTWMHKNAQLSSAEKVQLTAWAQSVMTAMQQKYPIDSLVRKK